MIVDEDQYMALDEKEKKKYIIVDHSLESYKLHQLTSLDHFVPSKEAVEMTLMPLNVNYRGMHRKRGGGRYNNNPNNHSSSGSFHNQNPHSANSNVDSSNQLQMTYVSDIERKTPYMQGQPDQQCYYQQQSQVSNEQQQPLNLATPMYSAQPHQGWTNHMIPIIPSQHQQIQYAPLNYQHVMPYGNFTIPPPIHSETASDLLNIISEADLSSSSINWQPKESVNQEADDLPYDDVTSLQFFFNLGVRYYLASGVQRRLESVALQMGNLELNTSSQGAGTTESVNAQAATKIEAPPVPTNTPVSTKTTATHGPPGNRFHENRNSGNTRRSFSNREDGGYRSNWTNNPRKEIKFNSNVKNLHKNEPKIGSESGPSSKVMIQTQTFHASGNTQMNAGVPSHDKSSPPSGISFASSISPVLQEVPYQPSYQPFYHQQSPIMASQQPMMAPQQQGVAMIFQVSEDGSYINPMSSGIQYAHSYRKLLYF